MKKLVVDQDKCICCGSCVSIDEEHFDFTDDGKSIPKSQENLETQELKDAVETCPVAASAVEESEEN